ncbi:hypothetical protein KSS87_020226, partial [Heliosperma pusillum]
SLNLFTLKKRNQSSFNLLRVYRYEYLLIDFTVLLFLQFVLITRLFLHLFYDFWLINLLHISQA